MSTKRGEHKKRAGDSSSSQPKKRAGDSRTQSFEHSVAGDGSSLETECRRTEEAPSQTCLSDLLYDKDFLWKVFGYLVEDGLDECRRVCRRWREVCSEFFTKHICGHWKDLADAHLKFPNAVSVSLSTRAPPPILIHRQNAWPSVVPSLTGIKRLEMDARFLYHCERHAQSPQLVCEYIATLVQLESLTLGSFCEFMEPLITSIAVRLTNLTHLQIDSSFSNAKDTTPLSGVRKLESLRFCASDLFTWNESNESLTLTFPSLTNLTRLEIVSTRFFDSIALEVCNAASLSLPYSRFSLTFCLRNLSLMHRL